MLTDVQAREVFHFTLLRRLVERLPEGVRLKGGVNLRLFFGSVRYSEDMDLDADPRLKPRMAEHLKRLMEAPEYRRELLALGIEDVTTKPEVAKATDTTLRLKVMVVKGGVPLPTKVEISFRETTPAEWAVRATPTAASLAVSFPDGVSKFEVVHYPHTIAVWQKVNALATRGGVQARDIFDLDWLFDEERFGDPRGGQLLQFLRDNHPLANLETARDRCIEIEDDQFREQVGAYLEPAIREQHESRWDEMRLRVQEMLGSAIALTPRQQE
jgi:hypothetical protein